jgi:hypothetical protein
MTMGKRVVTGDALTLGSRGRIRTRIRERCGALTSSEGARPAGWPSGSGLDPHRGWFGDILQYRRTVRFTLSHDPTIREAKYTAYR